VEDATTAHIGRHIFVTRRIRGGEDLVTVAELAGHSRLETLKVYSHPTDDDRGGALRHRWPLIAKDMPRPHSDDAEDRDARTLRGAGVCLDWENKKVFLLREEEAMSWSPAADGGDRGQRS
jgi:hypothetical protein